MNVESKTAIITGAGSGINFCFAKLLLSKGCNVVIADLALRPEAQELIAQYSVTSSGAKAVFQKTDVTDWGQLERMFQKAIAHFGGADIVCPGAGVYEPPFSNFWLPPGTEVSKDKVSESRYRILDINVTHPIRVTQMAIAHFLTHKKPGAVVHISSVAGQEPFFPTPMYVASKHAINGFVRSMYRLEHPPSHLPKIRVNAVAPARILTPLWTDHPEKLKMVNKNNPGWISPEAVADVMLDLIQLEEHVGGTIIEVGERIRKIEVYNDPGPSGAGNEAEHDEALEVDMWESLESQYNGDLYANGTNGINGANREVHGD